MPPLQMEVTVVGPQVQACGSEAPRGADSAILQLLLLVSARGEGRGRVCPAEHPRRWFRARGLQARGLAVTHKWNLVFCVKWSQHF